MKSFFVLMLMAIIGFSSPQAALATGPGPINPTNSAEQYLQRGYGVVWQGANYRGKMAPIMPGKKHYAKGIAFNFHSVRLPKDVLIMFTYKSRFGRSKQYQVGKDVTNLSQLLRSWDVRDKSNPWKSILYFEIKKDAKSPDTGNDDRSKAYMGKEWYNRYKTGYIVFSEKKYYDGDYEAKPNGDYDYRKLGFHPLSVYVPKSNRYLIMEYYAKNGKVKSAVIKKSIDDLDRYLYHLGVDKKYKKTPYKAVKRFAVIRQ